MNNIYKGEYCNKVAERIFMDQLEECRFYPKYFTIETCNNCNAKCIMCPKGQSEGIKTLQLMQDFVFDKILKEIVQYTEWIEMICLNSDGEPLIDNKLPERIKKLKDIGIKHVNISTNGQLLSEKMIDDLIANGLDDIRISIDGFSKETFENIRRGLNYDIVKKNVHNLIRRRNELQSPMSIRIRMVECEENENEREEFLLYWNRFLNNTTDKVQLMPAHTWSGKICEEESRKIDYYSDKPCVSVFSSFTINYDGKVQLCDSDIEQQMIMGNVNEKSIKEIWQSQLFEQVRFNHANGNRNEILICRGCDHWDRKFKERV